MCVYIYIYVYICIFKTVGFAQKLRRGVYSGKGFLCLCLYTRSKSNKKTKKQKKKKLKKIKEDKE